MEAWIGTLIGSQLQNGNRVQIVGDGHKKASFISLEDVAEVAVSAAGSQHESPAVLLSAEALSYREVIAQIKDVTGNPIEIETLQPGQRIERVPAQIRDILTELMTGLALGPEMNFTTPEVAKMFGIKFTTVKHYLKKAFVKPTLVWVQSTRKWLPRPPPATT